MLDILDNPALSAEHTVMFGGAESEVPDSPPQCGRHDIRPAPTPRSAAEPFAAVIHQAPHRTAATPHRRGSGSSCRGVAPPRRCERGGGRSRVLNDDEIIGTLMFLFTAGVASTASAIASTIVYAHQCGQWAHVAVEDEGDESKAADLLTRRAVIFDPPFPTVCRAADVGTRSLAVYRRGFGRCRDGGRNQEAGDPFPEPRRYLNRITSGFDGPRLLASRRLN